MENILTACEPRKDILAGTFNPEIFTASLSEVMRFYWGQGSSMHPMYTDAEEFFNQTTYPTDGLRMVLAEVFGRLKGDHTVPAIHRLETAFGGGKTHTLIGCAHLGFKGTDLAPVTADVLDANLLPKPGEVCVVGISGDEIPVHKPKGTALIPYTLWGEIAFQIGGEALYREIEDEAESYAAPGKNYFDTVFDGKKMLLMLDELAQYAARLSAARPGGGDQLSAFLMGLHGYARTHPGISVLLTLASATDAFANQTARLAKLLSQVTGKDISIDGALGIGQQAVESISSIVARDATAVVPVQAAEISRVLAKRLFTTIDKTTAEQTASVYMDMYQKNMSLLPNEATRVDFQEQMVAHYPFHPTLIDFLNNKLASYENFQGTRGVLRVLALTVRNLWQKKIQVPAIQTCHLDLREARTVTEIVGRTGSGALLQVLNADVGGADTESIAGGRSNAEMADQRNPHPENWPMYELTWKTVFLHSLVGRDQGLVSNIFGLTEQDALLEVAFPGLTPPQVTVALKEISNSAFYLRYQEGRYFASLDPSVNIALAKIRRSIDKPEADGLLDVMARKVVSTDVKSFHVVHDVSAPEHIPDKKGKPVLALVAPNAEQVRIDEMVTTAGPNTPRFEQNHVLILSPDTVDAQIGSQKQELLFGTLSSKAEETRRNLRDLARTVLAMQRLKGKPHDYGINPEKLEEDDFKQRFSEREKALETTVTESYSSLWFPSAAGEIVCKEIRTAGGESGVSVLEQIRKTLIENREIVTAEHATQAELSTLRKLFFDQSDVISIDKLRNNFHCNRKWPILEQSNILDQMVRAGVERGLWCLFRMEGEESTRPEEFYSREGSELPFTLDLLRNYSIITPEGARKRNWTKTAGPDLKQVQDWIRQVAYEMQVAKVSRIAEKVTDQEGDVTPKVMKEAIAKLVQENRLMAYKGSVDLEKKPELISGTKGAFYMPEAEDVLISPAKASEKGWIDKKDENIRLAGRDGAEKLFPLLHRIGSLYQRGGKSTFKLLDVAELALPKGGRLRISLTDIPPESVKDLGELFEVVSALAERDENTEAYLEIDKPEDDCPFIKELQEVLKKKKNK